MGDQSTDAPPSSPWSGLREDSVVAYRSGDRQEAMRLSRRAIIVQALTWFADEGVRFRVPDGEPSLDLILGLAGAARRVVDERGESVSTKLLLAAGALESIAAYRAALTTPIEDHPQAITDALLQFVFVGMDMGRFEAMMVWTEAGLVDAFFELERDREKRRLGAERTRIAKATVKERALAEAIKITGTNPTLSNEELANRIRVKLELSTTIRTMTAWVRDWRRQDYLPPLKR